jgi:ABC-type arginine/histidine transport system permease subunit
MLAISVIQMFMIYYGGALFRCVPLTPNELWFAVSTAFAVIPFDIARRIVEKLK